MTSLASPSLAHPTPTALVVPMRPTTPRLPRPACPAHARPTGLPTPVLCASRPSADFPNRPPAISCQAQPDLPSRFDPLSPHPLPTIQAGPRQPHTLADDPSRSETHHAA